MDDKLRALRHAVARRLPLQRRVERNLHVPGLRRRPTQAGSVWGVTMVRDEADIIEHTVGHLLRQGLAGVIVADNLSTDDTYDRLEALARTDSRIHVGRDLLSAYYQGRKMSYLVNLARRAGAEWVIPFDADEFWFAKDRSLADYLGALEDEVIVRAGASDGHATSIEGLDLDDTDATMRLSPEATTWKVAIRPHRWVWVSDGNHSAIDLGRPTLDGLYIAHLPRRSFAQFERKVTQGAAALRTATELRPDIGHHWRSAADVDSAERREAWLREVSSTDGAVVTLPTRWTCWDDRLVGTDRANRETRARG